MIKTSAKYRTPDFLLQWSAVLLSFGIAVWGNYPAFINDYLKTDDARANIFWFHRLLDPELFQNDLLTDYAIFLEALGPKYFYTWASYLMDPFLLEKLVPIFLHTLTGWILYRLGHHLAGPWSGFLFTFTFVCFPSHLELFNAGYSRTFAYPGVILGVYFLTTRRIVHMMWLSPLMALFYPIVFLINSTTWFFWVVIRLKWRPVGIAPKRLITVFIAGMLLSAPCVIPKYLTPDDRFGRLMNYEETVNHPGSYKNGRNKILPKEPYDEKILDALDEPFIILSFLVIFFFLDRKPLSVPLEFWLTIASGWLLYELAYQMLLTLYFPYKYFRYSFVFIMFFIISLGFGRLLNALPNHPARLAGLVVIAFFGYHYYGDQLKRGGNYDDYREKVPLYDYLHTLPKDALIAAKPYLADDFPLFAARKVLINFELASPWFVNHWATVKERTEDFYAAYYASRLTDIIAFRDKYQVDYLVVDSEDFKLLDRKRFYFNPFNDFIRKRIEDNRHRFFLPHHLKRLSQFQYKNYHVIDTSRLDRLQSWAFPRNLGDEP
ncbi:MAG: hypothetical protein HQL52_10515 [Magnetococcales bacterium]|nr:hypothetical protein [Magnetococcales bacterium]